MLLCLVLKVECKSMTNFFLAPENVNSLPYALINHHEKYAQFIKEKCFSDQIKVNQNALYIVSCLRMHEIWNQCSIQLCILPYWKKKSNDVYWRNEGIMIDLVVLQIAKHLKPKSSLFSLEPFLVFSSSIDSFCTFLVILVCNLDLPT